jgi:hypothetical protein
VGEQFLILNFEFLIGGASVGAGTGYGEWVAALPRHGQKQMANGRSHGKAMFNS